MFNISDRLKAAVNSIEATGTHLQQRAIGQNQHHQSPSSTSNQSTTSTSKPSSPSVTRGPSATNVVNGAKKDGGEAATAGTSPTKTASGTGYVGSTSALAEGALSGLRKSFNFSRPSLDSQRAGPSSPRASSSGPSVNPPSQELKDLPTSPVAGTSRPASPARFLNAASFALGSDPSSVSGTPRARSPGPASSLTKSPLTVTLPPDPDDPATYPLPPSPTLSPLPVSAQLYADPLGASPLLPPIEHEVPSLGFEAPTPAEEKDGPDAQLIRTLSKSAATPVGDVDETEASSDSKLQADGDAKGDGTSDLAKAERRYEDLSNRFTTLLTQKHNADRVLKELTPLEGGIGDHEALEGWVRMMKGKVDMITDEMKRLQGKIALQESRIEELRDTHRLEGTSQTELITKLRGQLSTAETSLAQKATDTISTAKLKDDLAKAQTAAKEEEEKRTKAISLLKTVRMKLVKVEKEKEEIEKDRAEERAERSSAKDEVERIKAEKEREVNVLRKGFERELASVKERYEKDLQAKKAAWELEMITTKASHAKEISGKSTKVLGLESIVKELNITSNNQFQELQAKQAEVEASRSELESLRNRTRELEFQLREADERATIAEASRGRPDGLSPSRASSPARNQPSTSSAEVQRLLADAEARAESKVSDLRNKIRSLETERNDAEEEWAAKLSERVRELEKLRRIITEKESEFAENLRNKKENERVMEQAEEARKAVEKEMRMLRAELEEAKANVTLAAEAERMARDELSGLQLQITSLSTQLDEAKSQATTLRSNNKTLREELRKVQSSVQLLEKSRNPGVGYWASNNQSRAAMASPDIAAPGKERRSMESSRTGQTSLADSGATTPAPSTGGDSREEEEVNLEYLRNVILQFLEHKEMRPNLVRVLSVILRFTPQELRRLNAKILA